MEDREYIARVARDLYGAMVVRHPPFPVASIPIPDVDGQPAAMVTLTLGRENVEMVEAHLKQLEGKLHHIHIPDAPPPPPPPEGPEAGQGDGSGVPRTGGDDAQRRT